jgi:hypothetical protein
MILNSGIKYRSIPSNKEFSFSSIINLNNTSGISNFGFSGESEILNFFSFKSGKILDFNNRHVFSYNPNEDISISGNMGYNFINYFINNLPICLYCPRQTGYFNNFYINTANSTINFNLVLQSESPSFNFNFPQNVNFGQDITGSIVNLANDNLKSFKIFTGGLTLLNVNYLISDLPGSDIYGGQSGAIKLNFNDTLELQGVTGTSLLLNLTTNFGAIEKQIDLIYNEIPIYFIDFITGFTGITGLKLEQGLLYNYELQSIFPENQNFEISLINFSGNTGQEIFDNTILTGDVSGDLTGFIHGSDFIFGDISAIGVALNNNVDYFGNIITGELSFAGRAFTIATGDINYSYNLLFSGGSGFGPAPIGTKITGLGIAYSTGLESFIFRNRSLTGIGTGNLTGVWGTIFQASTGEAVIRENKFFTGELSLDISEFIASGGPLDLNLDGPDQKLIYGITGDNLILNYAAIETGVKNLNITILHPQITGTQLTDIIPFKTIQDFNISGLSSASENTGSAPNLFYNSFSFWFTSAITQTGYVDFNFSKFSENDKKIVTHYSFEVDLNSNYYPYVFSLEGFNNYSETPTILDTRTGENFYSKTERFFELKNTGNFNIIRFKINSGLFWPHRDSINTFPLGIRINKLRYFNGNFVSGYFEPLNINNNIISNKFIDLSAENGNIFTSYDTGNSWSQKSESLPWVGIDMSYDGRIQSAVASGDYIYVSYNSGETWTEKADKRSWRKIVISKLDGRYQFAITNRSGFFSSNSGQAWSVLPNLNLATSSELISNSISENGQYLSACASNGFLWSSSNFGGNWVNGNSTSFSNNNWSDITMSADGQILTAVVFSGSAFSLTAGRIFRSFDGGLNWSAVTTSPVNQRRNWRAVSMSHDARYQIALEFDGTGFLSINSGLNWSTVNLTGLDWQDVAISYSGDSIAAIEDSNKIKISINSGQNWSEKEEPRPWRSIALSKDALIQSAVAQPPYVEIFSSNNLPSDTSYKAFNTGDSALISGISDNFFLTYKAANPINENYNYFYIKFVNGFLPSRVLLQKSLDNINYTSIYQKNLNINNIETGNVVINSGTQYFKWSFGPVLSCENINISNDTLDPIVLDINKDQIKLCGVLSGTQANYYTINNTSKFLISNIGLTTYNSDSSSIFNLQTGFYFSSGADTGQYISSGLINNNFLLFNLLTSLPKNTATTLDSGIYNIQIESTGEDIIDYEFVVFSADIDQCLATVDNAGFDISGQDLDGVYSISNRYNISGTWNNKKYYENKGKDKSLWWDGNFWILGGGLLTDTSPNDYTYIYASGDENVLAPYFVSRWVAQIGRPNPNVYRNCI